MSADRLPTDLPRDTPLDTPRVDAGLALSVPAEPGKSQLAALSATQTLEAAYDIWVELRQAHRSVMARLDAEQQRLKDEGAFVIGTVEAARRAEVAPAGDASTALETTGGADDYLTQAKAKLAAGLAEIESLTSRIEASYQQALTQAREQIIARVDRYLQSAKPRLRLMIRMLPGDRRVVHVARVAPDDAVLLCKLLTGRVPSRYGYLFDDSTDDAQKPPPNLYAEEGVVLEQQHPAPASLCALLEAASAVLPVKACIPFKVTTASGPMLAWLKQRGPVMEAEVEEGSAFRSVLSATEAESVAAVLLKLKLEGKIELELIRES